MSKLFNFLSIASVIGIWPRFFEPYRLRTTELYWDLPPSYQCSEELKIVHISDLHFGPHIPDHFLDTIVRKTMRHHPDLLLFSGDFLCFSEIREKERLQHFLSRFKSPLGCYTVLGNHDYANYVCRTPEGNYQIGKKKSSGSVLKLAMNTLLSSPPEQLEKQPDVHSIEMHKELVEVLNLSPFTLLENTTVTIANQLNLTGLGEYTLGRARLDTAFKGYRSDLPGLTLVHNPDTFPLLHQTPGEWVLAGHSHGEQIHLPYPPALRALSRKLARLENPQYSRGITKEGNKTLYTNRGLGSSFPFRFCSPPEILLLHMRRSQ
jgi:uncharacterized protein